MYKAIKDNKIIAINDTGDFPCLVFDEVVEDTQHKIFDYVMVGEEFVLNSNKKAIEKKNQERIAELEEYLKSTDWYCSRFVDTGEEIPAEIKKARQDAREKLSKLKAQNV